MASNPLSPSSRVLPAFGDVPQQLVHVHDENCGHDLAVDAEPSVLLRLKDSAEPGVRRRNANFLADLERQEAGLLREPSSKVASGWRLKCQSETLQFSAMLVLTGGFAVVEMAVGLYIGSLALQADAYHMISDVLALCLGLYASKSARRAATASATFGLVRWEVVGALINAVFLLAVALQVFLESLQRLAVGIHHADDGSLADSSTMMLSVGAAGLGINLLGLVLFSHGHGHGHSHGGHGHSHGGGHGHGAIAGDEHGHSHGAPRGGESGSAGGRQRAPRKPKLSMNISGVLLHLLGDALGSIGVMVAGSIMAFTDWPHKELADPLASLAIVLIITAGTVPLLRRSVHVLLECVPVHIDLAMLRGRLLALPGVLSIHDLHVWSLGDSRVVGSLHVIIDRTAAAVDYRRIIDGVKGLLHEAGVHASTVQPEFVSEELQRKIAAMAQARASVPPPSPLSVAAAMASGSGLPVPGSSDSEGEGEASEGASTVPVTPARELPSDEESRSASGRSSGRKVPGSGGATGLTPPPPPRRLVAPNFVLDLGLACDELVCAEETCKTSHCCPVPASPQPVMSPPRIRPPPSLSLPPPGAAARAADGSGPPAPAANAV